MDSRDEGLLSQIDERCASHGIRLTAKRRQVLLGLMRSSKALSAYELADYCKEHYGNVLPPMSIYRILGFLESQKLVHKLKLANKYIACAHIDCDHGTPQFLICVKCHKVKEASISPPIMEEIEDVVATSGFSLLTPQLELSCVCTSCEDPA